jgi:hypothetical protein
MVPEWCGEGLSVRSAGVSRTVLGLSNEMRSIDIKQTPRERRIRIVINHRGVKRLIYPLRDEAEQSRQRALETRALVIERGGTCSNNRGLHVTNAQCSKDEQIRADRSCDCRFGPLSATSQNAMNYQTEAVPRY